MERTRIALGRINVYLAATLLIAGVAAFPLLAQPGLLNTRGGGDSPFLLQRLQQLETAVLDGHFPVRWMPDANYGYGYPFFNYYAPLSIYIAFLFRLIGFSYVWSIQLAQLAGFLVAAWAMFVLARRWFQSEWAGVLTAVAYTTAPFHLVNIYVRGDSLAEFWAMAFYPLVILAADETLEINTKEQRGKVTESKRRRRRAVALLGLAYAGLILSHNISALIFSPFLILYILLRWLSLQRSARHSPLALLLPPFLGGVLGLALAFWFFMPALTETGLAQLGAVTEGYFFYGTHFLGTDKLSLWQNSFFFDFSVNGRNAFRMGLIQTIIGATSLLTLLYFWIKNSRRSSVLNPQSSVLSPYPFILLTTLFATFLILPLSQSLWETVPLLSFTQFPWRFLSVQAFGLALAAGGLSLLPGRKWFVPAVGGLLLLTSLGQLHTDHLILTDADVTAEKLAQYEWFTGNIGTTVSAEYLPPTVQPRPYTSAWLNTGERERVTALAGELTASSLVERKTDRQVWQVETAVPTTLRFNTLYWPGWQAFVDGRFAAIRPSAGSGLIELDVAAGVHEIELKLTRTLVRQWAEMVSFTAVIILAWLLGLGKPTRVSWRRTGRRVGWFVGLLVGVVILVRLWPQPIRGTDTLTWDFAQIGYLHHAPDGILFENGVRLLGYEIDRETVQAGETVTIVLNWAELPPPVTVALTTPAVNRPEFSPSAPAIVSATTQQSVVHLIVPETAVSGLVVPRVTLDDGRSLTPSGRKRGDLFLRPIRIVGIDTLTASDQSLDARAVQVMLAQSDVLDVQVGWWTERPLSENYNVALRLTDANGNFLRLADHQPGYGYLPSSAWPTKKWVMDQHAVPLPPVDEGHQQPFVLVAQLYEVANPSHV
ncbi:MAG: hypothetical protein KC419_04700, partial [Anaerolineales bacterium]|nr:hypothetical protein [Anaerolineales bacterium]